MLIILYRINCLLSKAAVGRDESGKNPLDHSFDRFAALLSHPGGLLYIYALPTVLQKYLRIMANEMYSLAHVHSLSMLGRQRKKRAARTRRAREAVISCIIKNSLKQS